MNTGLVGTAVSPVEAVSGGENVRQGKTGISFSALLGQFFSSNLLVGPEVGTAKQKGDAAFSKGGVLELFEDELAGEELASFLELLEFISGGSFEGDLGELLAGIEEDETDFLEHFLLQVLPPDLLQEWKGFGPEEKALALNILFEIAAAVGADKPVHRSEEAVKENIIPADLKQFFAKEQAAAKLTGEEYAAKLLEGKGKSDTQFLELVKKEAFANDAQQPGFMEKFAGAFGEELEMTLLEGEQEKSTANTLSRVGQFLKALLFGEKGRPLPEGFGFLQAQSQDKGLVELGKQNTFFSSGSSDGHISPMNARPGDPAARSIPLPAEVLEPQKVFTQVIERVGFLARPGREELRIQLHPQYLGEVFIKMRRANGALSAEITTQHIAVKELLEGQLENLRQRFGQMGLDVEDFSVSVDDGGKEGFDFPNNDPRRGHLSRASAADSPAGEEGLENPVLAAGNSSSVDYLV